MKAATERQKQMLEVIKTYTQNNGFPPSVREIGAAMGISSPNGVSVHLKALRRKGLLTKPEGRQKARAIVLT